MQTYSCIVFWRVQLFASWKCFCRKIELLTLTKPFRPPNFWSPILPNESQQIHKKAFVNQYPPFASFFHFFILSFSVSMSTDTDRMSRASSSTVIAENQDQSIDYAESKHDAKIQEEPVTASVDLKQQKRASRKRVLTFIGLQLTLFLAALDG